MSDLEFRPQQERRPKLNRRPLAPLYQVREAARDGHACSQPWPGSAESGISAFSA